MADPETHGGRSPGAGRDEDLSGLLRTFQPGDRVAEERLFRAVYEELARMAHRQLLQERTGHSLQTTALVNEAYLRLVDGSWQHDWQGRRHFFWAAAESMRRILVEHARRLGAAKRGGGWDRVELDPDRLGIERGPALVALDDAITSLESFDPRKALIVKLRYFVGLTVEETAQVVDLGPRTVKQEWRIARLWLRRELVGPGGSE